MLCESKSEEKRAPLERLAASHLEVKQLRLPKKLVEQGFLYDLLDLFGPIRKSVKRDK